MPALYPRITRIHANVGAGFQACPAPPTAWDYIVYHDTRTAILWKVPIDFVRIIVYNMY